ncbi:hypothetical protein [Helicobacter pullorum]|uniref:hypothetical protein n=1 Tax=Helicobacter pullorum TaxID=35818 RepID=UPI0008168356|nr:hypothetical protein [Helicobacter pullorum]OCR12508.1 hypothetical protein BA916_08570 [Helicobacter pullorum]
METTTFSKPLSDDDSSGYEFAKEMLCGDPTFAINFDRIQKHPKYGYIIFEYLRCHEKQSVTPYTSHPNRYFFKNSQKFISLFQIANELSATLYLVNYAKKGTIHEDKIKLMKVISIDGSNTQCPVATKDKKMTRAEFSSWFRKLNKECDKSPN